MTEIRSYRRVFDLERRIYSVEQIRLNPSGVPVRGVVYLLAAVAAALMAARVPLLGSAVRTLPWFVRDLALPAGAAAALTVIRIDGRTFHHVAGSVLSFWLSPRRRVGLGSPSEVGVRWRPEDIVFLPDGSDAAVRRCSYAGPGSVTVMVRHRTEVRARRRLGAARTGRQIRLLLAPSSEPLRRRRTIALERGTSLVTDLDRRSTAG